MPVEKSMDWIQSIDASILLFIQEHIRNEAFHGFWKAITFLGDGGWFWIALGIVLLIPKKTRRAGFTALIALGIGALITNVCLKPLVGRIRPYDAISALESLVGKMSDYSFPSGHTCASFASAFVYYRVFPKKYGISAMVLAALIAVSRLYVGVHYPTDVLGGLIVGLVSGGLACYLMKEKYKNERK